MKCWICSFWCELCFIQAGAWHSQTLPCCGDQVRARPGTQWLLGLDSLGGGTRQLAQQGAAGPKLWCWHLLLMVSAPLGLFPLPCAAVCRLAGVWCNPVTCSTTPGDKGGPEDGEQHKRHPKTQHDRQQTPPCVCLPAQPITSSQVPPMPVAQLRTSHHCKKCLIIESASLTSCVINLEAQQWPAVGTGSAVALGSPLLPLAVGQIHSVGWGEARPCLCYS